MRSFLKDLLNVGKSKVLILVFGLLNSILIARLLGPSVNGIISSLLVYPSLIMSVGSLGIRQSTTYYVGKQLFKLDLIKSAIVKIWFVSSLLSVVLCVILIKYFSDQGDNLWWIVLAVFPIPFTLFNTYNSGIFLGKNNITVFNRINWIPSLITFIATLVLIWIFEFNVAGVLIAIILGNLAVFIIFLIKDQFFQFFKARWDFSVVKSMLSLGLVYAVALLVINLNYRLDIILLDNLSTNYQVGIYSKGVRIIELIWQIPSLLSTVIFARSAVAKSNIQFSLKVLKLLRVSFLLVILMAIILFISAPLLIPLLYGEEFKDSITVLQFILPGIIVLTLFKVINMDLAGKGKPRIALLAMIPALVVNIGLNLLLIPIFKANGAAIASSISYTIGTIIFLMLYKKEMGFSYWEIFGYRSNDFDFIQLLIKKVKRTR